MTSLGTTVVVSAREKGLSEEVFLHRNISEVVLKLWTGKVNEQPIENSILSNVDVNVKNDLNYTVFPAKSGL